jgi:methyl-accepting chemotaxis protein
MVKNASIRTKLTLVALIPTIALVIASILAVVAINAGFNDMNERIVAQNYEAISLVLNADRDMYQAMLALHSLEEPDVSEEEIAANLEDLESNLSDVRGRMKEAQEKFPVDDRYWTVHRDKNNKLIFDYFNEFNLAFQNWEKDIGSPTGGMEINIGIANFEAARETLNLIGEMLDAMTKEIVLLNEKNKNTNILGMLGLNTLVYVVIAIFLLRMIRMISKPIQELTACAEKISEGETDFVFAVDTTDEIGRLKRAFSGMVAGLKQKTDAAVELSKGNLDVNISAYSDKDKLALSMIKLKETLSRMTGDINALTKAAMNGELSVRTDADRHQGEFRKIIEGVNATLDAIVSPINEVALVMEGISHGNLGVMIRSQYKGDYDKLAGSINQTVEGLRNMIGEISEVLEKMSEGNLDIEPLQDYEGDFGRISESINMIITALNELIGEISKASEQVAAGSKQVSEGSMHLSQGATEQASSIEELSSGMAEMSSRIKMNAANAAQANQIALEAKENAVKGNMRMKDMLKSMEDINEASGNISKIIKVIDDIAFQTNILALNAAVEAARAGQHGKGFAVVAEEVRNLAARSADAANETTEFIEATVKKVDMGTKIANETAASLLSIVESSARVAELVEEIADASTQQAGGISQINIGIDQVSQVVQTNSATAEESAAASEELMTQAQLLNDNVSRFQLRNDFSKVEANAYENGGKKVNPGKKSKSTAGGTGGSKRNTLFRKGNNDFGKY